MQTQTHHISLGETEVRKRFRNWADGEPDREWGCLRVIWAHAPGLAPRPLRRETSDGCPVVVMSRVPGIALGTAPLLPSQTRSLGSVLRQLYDIPHRAIVDAGLPERRLGPTTLPTVLRGWLAEDHDLSACKDRSLVAAGVDAARNHFTRSESLPTPVFASLGIADLNPANIIWDGERCRLVDFEDGGLTDPAYDLADHGEHIASRIGGVIDIEALTDAVGLSDDERGRMIRYRPLWATFWLMMLLPGNGAFRRNPVGTTELQARHLIALLARS
ncbi:MAG: aminoglycoside phosphotransferase family protein [Microbacterium sp.]|jgi:aminoglycoside phosphotransferase (APT) family kinase protein|nr:aminoglycoside phosphotransferase family protein [Microbacterium sp.]